MDDKTLRTVLEQIRDMAHEAVFSDTGATSLIRLHTTGVISGMASDAAREPPLGPISDVERLRSLLYKFGRAFVALDADFVFDPASNANSSLALDFAYFVASSIDAALGSDFVQERSKRLGFISPARSPP